ncbi:hypothetical protein BO94DRAFT_617531 [Aspergillus sclerotioniger CBS 115572]|uniref:WD40 repeat-like protein n=1 Tax=Aspergillus sclerotioniger CBS 115572 TaxID=1450535 RepID=A0A317WZQ9_9EURO|nr:hypothetical protein BO94DRAFT_617531 [Aspergillus sclerotioniger CBS 115572]PWY91876.1 hypothetical protein BO94DRAFT_617531 [Aspergillus sclerotioniger CBS 115572]
MGFKRYVSREGTVQFWDPDTTHLRSGMSIGSTTVATSPPDGRLLFAVSEQGRLQVWNLARPTFRTSFEDADLEYWGTDTCVAWLPQTGTHVMVASTKGIRIWEASTGKLQKKFESSEDQSLPFKQFSTKMTISPHGNLILAYHSSALILEWISGASMVGNDLVHKTGSFRALSPNGTFMITVERNSLLVWDMKTQGLH